MYWISDYIKSSSLYISLISSTNSKASGYLVVKERRKLPSALLQANMGAKQMLATKILQGVCRPVFKKVSSSNYRNLLSYPLL